MKIILFRGRPGTGKTTLSDAYSRQTDLPVLRKDDVYDVAAEFVTEHAIRNGIAYQSLYKILESNTQSEVTFILDYPFQHPGDLAILRKWCDNHGVDLTSILVTCSDEQLWARRLDERALHPQPNQMLTDFDAFQALYGTMQLVPEEDELRVDTIYSVEEIISQVADFVIQESA